MTRQQRIAMKALVAFLLAPVAQAKTCLMLYQMADNNLEYYLRQDYQELTNSAVVRNSDLRTWVYHDSLNQGGQPLPNTVDSNGQTVSSRFTGSRYITYDSSLGKMRVDTTLNGGAEINSDTEGVIRNFMTHALRDCLNNGHDSLMAVFSSHGGGFAGYGGDENTRHRNLLQLNRQVASAIRGALSSVDGAPSKLDVIGFDACLMQAFGAADDYQDIANHILASEAVEPGHGWAYAYLTNAQDALSLSRQVVNTFLSQTQGGSYHQSPKQLSIVNTDGFKRMVSSLEDFSSILLDRIKQDQTLHAFVARARSSAVAFEGIVDAVGTSNPSGMDIGSFLNIFASMCNAPITSDLGGSLADTRDAYNSMLVAQGIGPGTAAGTGMHLTWPNKGEYQKNRQLWNTVLFNSQNYATFTAPRFMDFLEYFLNANTPSSSGGTSICNQAAQSSQPQNPDELLFDTKTDIQSMRVTLSAEMAPSVDQVVVEYAVDLSSPLKPFLSERGYVPYDEEYLYLKGGNVRGSYQGSRFTAEWNRDFYFLNITGSSQYEALYVQDQGNGAKAVPVMYFPESAREEVSKLAFLDFLFFDFDGWVQRGARYSFLTFSVSNGIVDNNLILFTSDASGNVFAEKPRADGGLIVPIIYVDALIQETKIDTLPGGFNQTIINWRQDLDYNVISRKADRIFDVIQGTDAVVATMYGYDFAVSQDPVEAKYFDIIRPDRGGGGSFDDQLPVATDSESASSAKNYSSSKALVLTVLGAFLVVFQAMI